MIQICIIQNTLKWLTQSLWCFCFLELSGINSLREGSKLGIDRIYLIKDFMNYLVAVDRNIDREKGLWFIKGIGQFSKNFRRWDLLDMT